MTDLQRGNELISLFNTRSSSLYWEENETYNQPQYVVLSQDQEILIIIRHNRGINFYEAARYSEANSDFDAVLRINSTFGPGLYYKGLCLEKLGRADEAESYRQRALEIAPEYKGERLDRTLIQVPNLPLEGLFPAR